MTRTLNAMAAAAATSRQSKSSQPSASGNHKSHEVTTSAPRLRPGLVPNEEHWRNDKPILSGQLSQEFGCIHGIVLNGQKAWYEVWCQECGQNAIQAGSHPENKQRFFKGLEGLKRHYVLKHSKLCMQKAQYSKFSEQDLLRVMGKHLLTGAEVRRLCLRQAVIKTVGIEKGEASRREAAAVNVVAINDIDDDEILRHYNSGRQASLDVTGTYHSEDYSG